MQQHGQGYQFKHLKLAADFPRNDLELAGQASAGWEVVSMAIDRQLAAVEFVYLLRKPM